MARQKRKTGTTSEPVRGEFGSAKESMSERQPWPYAMKEHRDRNAEHLQDAKRVCEELGASGTLDSKQSAQLFCIYQHITDALRHMERAGAPTEPQ